MFIMHIDVNNKVPWKKYVEPSIGVFAKDYATIGPPVNGQHKKSRKHMVFVID